MFDPIKAITSALFAYCDENTLNTPILVAASKTQTSQTVRTAIDAGLTDIGENYIQEAQKKAAEGAYTGAKLHLIGRFQSNKAKDVAALFDVVHSLDKEKSAQKLDAACKNLNKIMDVFIQVHIGPEANNRSGVTTTELPKLAEFVRTHCPNLNLIGLMTMPPANHPAPIDVFREVKKLGDALGLKAFSMGMSGDWQQALRAGATHIRMGTALFGKRTP